MQELEKGRCLVSMTQSSAVRDGYIWSIPASNLIVTPSRTVFEMPQTSEVCNHLSSIHAMALVTLMVRCSQLAVAGAKPADKFESLAGLQIHYIKKARGTLRAVCEQVVIPKGGRYEIPCTIYDSDEDVVAFGTLYWRVSSTRIYDARKSAHPAALSNIVEMATGLALNYGLPAGSRSILTAFRMEFLYDAGVGKISAECDSEGTEVTSDGAHQIEANLSDSRGHVFAYGVASWKVG